MQYLGDFAEDATVYIPFNTFDSNDPQASATITNLVDADIKVHKDGGLTQIATDGATIAIDYDGITGNHLITIDTSVHADYAIGSDYMVRIEGTTVDVGTINAWIGSFSIENRFNEVKVVAWNGVALSTTNPLPNAAADAAGGLAISDAGGLDLDAMNTAAIRLTAARAAVLTDWINGGRLDLLLDAIPTTAMRGTDNAALASVATEARLAELDAANLPANINAIVADTNELQTDWANGGRLDLILDATLAMLDDPRAEPGQGAPAVNADAMTKLDYVYKFMRNKIETTSTEIAVYDDAGTTKDQKADISDDGATYTRNEFISGA